MSRRQLTWVCVSLAAIALVGIGINISRNPRVVTPLEPVAQDPPPTTEPVVLLPIDRVDMIPGPSQARIELAAGETIEISCRIVTPSMLSTNGRVRVEWRLVDTDESTLYSDAASEDKAARDDETLGIYTKPTPNWSKVLHALDPDVYLVYQAPVSGAYQLSIRPEEGPVTLFEGQRWREDGKVADLMQTPREVAWPKHAQAEIALSVRQIDLAPQPELGLFVEAEPNDTPEQAVPIPLRETDEDYTLHVVGGSDDLEYFDNGQVGASGDDWYRLEFRDAEERLLTACLSIPDQQVAARIRCYVLSIDEAKVEPGKLLPIRREYSGGKNMNERVHQQAEPHRIAINRTLRPNHVYFLRVEANAPGYELELRVVRPAPFDDPQQAIRHAMYDHIGQVDSWLMNRPRAVSVERRIRDTGNLLGTGCMSCHTQAGVWGPAIPLAQGYRLQNIQLMRNLVNICYQSMRPTNKLIDAANNASLAPLDLGDGPAGTRVAGHAVVSYERYRAPRKLHSSQAIRAANNVLQTSDPSGVNAAGPGANVGQGVVLNYAGEVVWSAWKATGDPKYFRALEDKARAVLKMKPKFTDDLAHRVELLTRYFPQNYVELAVEVAEKERDHPEQTSRVPYDSKATSPEEANALWRQIQDQVSQDLDRLQAVQNDDGSWGFSPGKPVAEGSGWRVTGHNLGEPSPTALALIAFEAGGFQRDHATVANGVKALLEMQKPTGYWKGSSLTGFVSTAYAINALSRLYPTEPPAYSMDDFTSTSNETLLETLRRVRDLSVIEDPEFVPLMLEAAKHSSPLVRYWAMIALGSVHQDACVEPLIRGLGDRTKMVREAAHWGLRQALIDNRGWLQAQDAAMSADDYTRESAMRALVMRVDGVLPEIDLPWAVLTDTLEQGMNYDPHPAVRSWAMRAAWNWWYWNPPVRKPINQAWLKLLTREETDALVENSIRYHSHALFVVNGHHANASNTHQYKELGELFASLKEVLDQTDTSEDERVRLTQRLVGIAATFYSTAGGDGGPGQMGYATPGADELFGHAFIDHFQELEEAGEQPEAEPITVQVALEGAANISHEQLQQRLIHYSLNGPENLRTIAASSVSDPRSAQLVAVPEMIEPLVQQVHRGALDPPRRPQLSDPIVKLFGRVRWMVPNNLEQQREILGYLIPELDEFASQLQIDAISDAARRQEVERRMSADRYLAEELGDVLGKNPDLHFDTVLEFFPEQAANPLQARFWLPSVPWILTHHQRLPEIGGLEPASEDDPLAVYRGRALELFLQQLSEDAERKTRELAVNLAQATELRSDPQVIDALQAMLQFDKNPTIQRKVNNILSQQDVVARLTAAVKREEPPRVAPDAEGNVSLSPEFVEDFQFFRDYVMPEMNRPQRADERSCFSCHGVPGRVPPLTLKKPNSIGYLSVTNLLANYRLLQERIDLDDFQRSKLLRKPLNIQTGEEDGHQGGLRYRPTDYGYLVLREWVENQVEQRDDVGLETAVASGSGD
jgi:hypothetical protein